MPAKVPQSRRVVPGSEKEKSPTAKAVGKVDPNEVIEVTIMLRPSSGADKPEERASQALAAGKRLPEDRAYVTREQFAAQHGASAADVAKVEAFAHDHHLTIVQISAPECMVKVNGRVADLMAAFDSDLKKYRVGKVQFRGRSGPITVPKELEHIVVGVFGLDDRPAWRPHCRRLPEARASTKRSTRARVSEKRAVMQAHAAASAAPPRSFTPPEIASLYNFPTGLDGSGQTIAIIELNNKNKGKLGTGFDAGDLAAYFKKLNIPLPDVTAVSVDKGANLPNIDPDSDGEVMLDIEVAGAIAPGAKIAVYFAPNTDKGFIDAISAAVHDNVRKPSVISISWGGPEDPAYTTKQSRLATDKILQDAANLGITVCCASGDDGSADLPLTDDQGNPLRDGKPHVDFPSSSPFALACGGTRLQSGANGAPVESVWNDGDPKGNRASGSGGGGVSNYFDKPDYQAGVNVPKSPKGKIGRGVPDVAGDADPVTGYTVRVAGKKQTYGGTSAVAPLWAGLVALINQRLAAKGKPPCGFINPILYQSHTALHDITVGNNDIDGTLGKYQAGAGWDPCSGLGTPDGTKVMQLLGG